MRLKPFQTAGLSQDDKWDALCAYLCELSEEVNRSYEELERRCEVPATEREEAVNLCEQKLTPVVPVTIWEADSSSVTWALNQKKVCDESMKSYTLFVVAGLTRSFVLVRHGSTISDGATTFSFGTAAGQTTLQPTVISSSLGRIQALRALV